MSSEPYEWKRGSYKNLSLRVVHGGKVRVTSPWYLPRFLVDRFVAEKAEWIADRRKALAPALDSILVWGTSMAVRIRPPGKLPRVLVDTEANEVIVRVPASWSEVQNKKLLDRWQKEEVRLALERLIPVWEAQTGLKTARWTVKKLSSRWGSCQPQTKSLVFNSRLAEFPPVCLEYVVVHELGHLIEPSHNARFHALVEKWLPGASEVRKLLKKAAGFSPPAGSGASPGPPGYREAGTAPSAPVRSAPAPDGGTREF